jgi:alpha-tubulin suppressor-like RCC1 family protein
MVNGYFYDVLLAPDGSLWAWGGLLAWGVPASLSPKDSFSRTPQRVGSDSNWRQVACREEGPVALKNDGSLWIWGFNQSGPNPTRISTETNWSQICAEDGGILCLQTDGSMWTWDSTEQPMAASLTNTNSAPLPRMIGTDRDWRMIAAASKTNFALKTNGTLWEWETEGAGSNHLAPRQVAPDTNWQTISSFMATFLALKTDGTLWTTSSNLANVASAFVPDPTREFTRIGPDTDWGEVYAGRGCFYARKKDGSWWASGWNTDGQLGFPKNTPPGIPTRPATSPQRLPFDFDAWAISGPCGDTMMLGKDGKLWCWGVRLGITHSSGARKKFETFVAPAVKRFPRLGFLIKSNILIDRTPHLLWELPAEVRRSLGREPQGATNDLTTTQFLHPSNK